MDPNSGRPPFDKKFEPLRRPHTTTQIPGSSSIPQQHHQQQRGLSVTAPEFVPRTNFSNGGVQHHHQQQPQQQINDPRILPGLMNSMKVSGGGGNNSVQDRLKQNQNHHCHQPQQHQQQQQAPHFHHHSNHQNRNHHNHHQHQHHQQQHPPYEQHQRHQQHQYGRSFQKNSVQNRLNAGYEQNNQDNSNNQNHVQESSQGQQPPNEDEAFAINYIERVINCLIENPGDLDTVGARLINVFEGNAGKPGFGNNEYVLSVSMEMIFKRSIEEQNFRYMGAKLYSLLDLIDLREDNMFRTLLNCKLSYQQNEVLAYMQNEQFKVRGTTLFLAELYMQLRNDGNRIKIIAANIVFSINQLLQKTTPENIKCICLTLKLAGYDLEFDFPQEMATIMEKLRETLNSLDVSTSRVLENVLSLQKNAWGRKNEPLELQLQHNAESEANIRYSDEPIFYGPDGAIITEEESAFLSSNIPRYEDDDSDIEVNPLMDAETEKAYKDFLKTNKQKKKASTTVK